MGLEPETLSLGGKMGSNEWSCLGERTGSRGQYQHDEGVEVWGCRKVSRGSGAGRKTVSARRERARASEGGGERERGDGHIGVVGRGQGRRGGL